MAAQDKRVLVSCGGSTRSLTVRGGDRCTERQALLLQVREMFRVPGSSAVILQVKDEEWGGEFVDYVQDDIPDKSVFQLTIQQQVCELGLVSKNYVLVATMSCIVTQNVGGD